ncbi:MAG: lipopolysaccharide biosynthesis protein [Alphaproteobacteria bacterium]|nr:lipopolysaccharide biosynthesis protein [Alphaproteobacteria bacterium]
MGTFRKQVIRGVGWRATANLGETLLQIGFTAILARLLEIADFGLAALCLVFIRFMRALTDVGFAYAVIQSRDVTDRQVSAIFCLQALIRFGVCLLCIAAAPLAARFFDQPQLTGLIRVLAWVIVLDSFAFPQTLLQKGLQFKGYSLLLVTSMIAGNLLGVAMAFTGYGVWSLIFRLLAQKLFYSTGIWFVARWVPKKPDFKGVRQLVQFGFTMFGSRLFNFFSQNLASIIIGKFIGVETLGLFNVAYSLAVVPAERIKTVLAAVLTPAFATLQQGLPQLRRYLYASLFSLGTVFIPLMLGMAAVSTNLVVILYGEKWREAGLFLTFLAVVGLMKGMEHLLRSVLVATGRAGRILRIAMAETAASVPLLFLGAYYYEVMGLVIAYLAASSISIVLTVNAVQRVVGDNAVFLRAIAKSLLVAGLMFAAVAAWTAMISFEPALALISQIALGATLYILIRIRLLHDEERDIVQHWPLVGRVIG